MFVGATRTLVRDVVLELPIQTGPSYLGPLARIGADLADAAQRGAATWLATGLGRLPARSAIVERYGRAVAGVDPRYLGRRQRPGRRARAARRRCLVEPDGVLHHPRGHGAVALRCRGRHGAAAGRGRACAARVARSASRPRPGVRPSRSTSRSSTGCCRRPPSASSTRWSTAGPAGLRLADRHAASNLVCLQVADASAAAATGPWSAGASAIPRGSIAGGDVAAFSPGRTLGVVWTSVTPARDDRLRIATPLHRLSFGSPLVSGDPWSVSSRRRRPLGRPRWSPRLHRARRACHPLAARPSAVVGSLHYLGVWRHGPVGPTSREDDPTMYSLRSVAAPLLLTVALGGTVAAQPRTVELVGTDNLKFSTTTVEARPGETLRIVVRSDGQCRTSVAHTFALLQPGTDPASFANEGAMHRGSDFIAPGLAGRVISKTPMAGAGETVEVTLTAPGRGQLPVRVHLPRPRGGGHGGHAGRAVTPAVPTRPEGRERTRARRPKGRRQARQQTCRAEHDCHDDVGERIARRHARHLRAEDAGGPQCQQPGR